MDGRKFIRYLNLTDFLSFNKANENFSYWFNWLLMYLKYGFNREDDQLASVFAHLDECQVS